MATVSRPTPVHEPREIRVLVHDVAWDGYEAMLQIVDERHIRVTYDAGSMEVCMPSQRHEQAAQWLGLFVTRLAEELEVPYEPLGMTSWKKASVAKGIEPDQCYYLQNHEVVRRESPLDLETDPPPDLAIEVDITSSSLNRMAIYAALGVPEVWRYDGQTLAVNQLQPDGQYQSSATSHAFPGLQPSDVEHFMELGRTIDKVRWARTLRDWVRDELIPRRARERPHG
ncbi:MAG: Uma2 family endonuclease [Isosphaeraceae bacterium]|nr:Uma2 family endonuclease [Isosphaeraceae bacterium]